MNSATTKTDALVIAGDITNYGKELEYLFLNAIFDNNPRPKNIILATGNHEFGNESEGDYYAYEERFMKVGKIHFVNTPYFHERDDFGTGFIFEVYPDELVLRARDVLNSAWRDFEYHVDIG